jgi:hypothetical protein
MLIRTAIGLFSAGVQNRRPIRPNSDLKYEISHFWRFSLRSFVNLFQHRCCPPLRIEDRFYSVGVRIPLSIWIRIRCCLFMTCVRMSRFLEAHRSTTARPVRFKFGMLFTHGVNSRSTLKFLWPEQFIDQDIDFSACVSVTLFRGSLLNNGATD